MKSKETLHPNESPKWELLGNLTPSAHKIPKQPINGNAPSRLTREAIGTSTQREIDNFNLNFKTKI